jgi:chemotaxis-related protein WspD
VLDGGTDAPVHDCWNMIGVAGNGTCRELHRFVHCRNCPVYAVAGRRLLDRPLSVEYRCERTQQYAAAKRLSQPARTSLVLFRLGSEWLALPTTAFQEVAPQRPIHTLPHRQRGLVLGLVNIRGELLICVSVARLLGLEPAARPSHPETRRPAAWVSTPDLPARPAGTGRELEKRPHGPPAPPLDSAFRLLVVQWNGDRFVFPVDEVHGIHRLPTDEIKEPPATISKSAFTHTRGVFTWRERTVGFLNPDSLFSALNRNLT